MIYQKKGSKKPGFFARLMKTVKGWFGKKDDQKKKIRKREKKTIFTSFLSFIYKWQQTIISVTIVIFVIILGILLLQKTIYAPRYTIKNVTIDESSRDIYNNDVLYEEAKSLLQGENYFLFNRGLNDEIVNTLTTEYPLVEDIELTLTQDSSVIASIKFHAPTIIFLLPEQRRYATYQETLYELGTGDFQSAESPIIQLPRYTQDLEDIDGVFYRISEKKLHSAYLTITNTLGTDNINEVIYLPGGQKFFIGYKAKRLYIDLNKDINTQLAKLVNLENYYEGFEGLGVIDLGSLDDVIVR